MTKKELRNKTNEELQGLYNSLIKRSVSCMEDGFLGMANCYIKEMQKILEVQDER